MTEEGQTFTEPDEYYRKRWNVVFRLCQEFLGEDDFQSCCEGHNAQEILDLLATLESNPEHHAADNLRKLEPLIRTLQSLEEFLKSKADHIFPNTNVMWGVLCRLLQAIPAIPFLLARVRELLSRANILIRSILAYRSSRSITQAVGGAAAEVIMDMVLLLSRILRFIRWHPQYDLAQEEWDAELQQDVTEALTSFRAYLDDVRERATIIDLEWKANHERQGSTDTSPAERVESVTSASTRPKSPHGSGSAESHIIGVFSPNRFFQGRTDILQHLHSELDRGKHSTSTELHCLVLWGIAGIGKTQTALAYVHERHEQGLENIFWIHSDTDLELEQSIAHILVKLQIPGVKEDGDHAQNKFLLRNWLASSSEEWLMVFDNVEKNMDHVRDCWPMSGKGSIIMTSRSEIVSIDITSIEVTAMKPEEGAQLLLKIAGHDSISESELSAAKALSVELGGLALALTVVAQQIRQKRSRVEDFLTFWKQDSSRVFQKLKDINLKPFYTRSLSQAWLSSFEALDTNTRHAFGIACFTAPDAIPVDLFRIGSAGQVPPELTFGCDSWSLDEVQEALVNLSLIGKDPDSDVIYVHRVIQTAFRNSLTSQERSLHLRNTSRLLFLSFPSLVNGTPLRLKWYDCRRFAHHVVTFASRLLSYHDSIQDQSTKEEFLECLASCAWYLYETDSWNESVDLINAGYKLCTPRSLLHANLLNTHGIIESKRNHNENAERLLRQSGDIRGEKLPEDHEELANVYNNLGNVYMSLTQYEVALDFFLRAVDIDMSKPELERNLILHIRHLNIGSAYRFLGDVDKARHHLAIGVQYSVLTLGSKARHYETVGGHDLACVDIAVGDLVGARTKLETAIEIKRTEGVRDFRQVCLLLKLGCVFLKDGKVDDAIKPLEECLDLAQDLESANDEKRHTARVLRTLSTVWSEKGDDVRAKEYHAAAETLRKQIQGSEFATNPDEEQTYDLLVAYFYR